MRRLLFLLILWPTIALSVPGDMYPSRPLTEEWQTTTAAGSTQQPCTVTSWFSPVDNVPAVIAQEIDHATQTVDCSLYGISNKQITQAMLMARARGVQIRLGIDQGMSNYHGQTWQVLQKAGVQVEVKKSALLEHNKFCIIDGVTVLEGSFNYSWAAEQQDNHMSKITGCLDTGRFVAAFTRIWLRDK